MNPSSVCVCLKCMLLLILNFNYYLWTTASMVGVQVEAYGQGSVFQGLIISESVKLICKVSLVLED